MYAVYTFNGFSKVQSEGGKTFASLDEAKRYFADRTICFDKDPDHDAADLFTTSGQVLAIEPLGKGRLTS